MKKGIKSLAIAALAVSALTPVAAASAAENVENGVYTSTEFYTLDAFKKLSTSKKAAALNSTGTVVVIGGQVFKASDVLTASDSQLPTLGTSADTYTTPAGNKLVSGKPLDTTAPVSELKVESVSAINATTLVLILNKPVTKAEAEKLSNYAYNNNTASATVTLNQPTAASVNTAKEGSYEAGQIVTLTLPTITAANKASIKAFGVETKFTVNAFDNTAPSITPSAVNQATSTITATVTDAGLNVAGAEYRLQRPDGTLTDWVNMTAVDGKLLDEKTEEFTATINKASLTPGTYKVEIRAFDAAGTATVAKTATTFTQTNSLTYTVASEDITGPTVSLASTTGVLNTAATATATKPANSITVDNLSVTDATSNVTKIEYRVQKFDSNTNSYSTAVNWANATAKDGSFNEKTELATFTTPVLEAGVQYVIEVRATDEKGNVSAVTALTRGAAASAILTGASTGLVNGSETNGFTIGAVTAANPSLTTGTGDNTAVTPTLTGGATSASAPAKVKTFEITGTADADIDNATATANVAKVEYAIYKNADNDAQNTYETLVSDFTSTDVVATDGTFDGAVEAYKVSGSVATDGAYRIVVKVTNTAGKTATATVDTWIDTTAPTLSIAKVANTNDTKFTFTYNEDVKNTGVAGPPLVMLVPDATPSSDALDPDNITVQTATGQIVTDITVVSITKVSDKVYTVEFSKAVPAGYQISVTGVEDKASNKIAYPTLITVQ